jgi:hypothetical protein
MGFLYVKAARDNGSLRRKRRSGFAAPGTGGIGIGQSGEDYIYNNVIRASITPGPIIAKWLLG